jgi:phenylacetate-CoA ligase
VLQTALAQLRYALSIALGRPLDVGALDQLVEGARATRHEFGVIASSGDALVGPALDERTRKEMQLRRFRGIATRAARGTAYYARLFEALGLNPARLRAEDIDRIPPTPKAALRDEPDAFVSRTGQPTFRTTTTGTTGKPTSVSFSTDELRAYVALGAIGLLVENHAGPEDIVQLSASARATLGNTCFAGACARVGAQVYMAGLVEPEAALALLTERRKLPGKKRRTSILQTYPSYLGQLVETSRRLGYRPSDFGLERIFMGGEVVTDGLKARARDVFGDVQFVEAYGMTEIWPLGGTLCEADHLHFEPARGLIEVLDDKNSETAPGEIGSIIATPFLSYRQTTLVLRYATEDLVRMPRVPPTCRLRNLAATGKLLGKRRLAVRHAYGWTTQRDVLEALEAVASVPLPARCGWWASADGVAIDVLVRDVTSKVHGDVERALGQAGMPIRELRLVDDARGLRHAVPMRGDLREAAFDTRDVAVAGVAENA